MSEVTLVATARTEFGKGAARRLRRADRIPAVLYGHGTDPVHVALPGHETMLAVKQANALVSVSLAGQQTLALVKDVQRDVVRNVIEHVDLLVVRSGEKVAVEVPVVIVGESEPGTIHLVEHQTLELEAEATHLPQHIEVSIQGLAAGAAVHGRDIVLPAGAQLLTDPDTIVVTVALPQAEEEAEATEEAAPAEA